MPMALKTKGIEEMQGKLKFLQQFLLDEAVREAARAGAAVILAEAQTRAPVRVDARTPGSTSLQPGAIRASLKIRLTKLKAGLVTALIGPTGRIKGIVASVEYGHVLIRGGRRGRNGLGVSVNVGGKVIGNVPAHEFLRPAFDQSADAAIAAASDAMREKIRKALG